MFIPHSPIRCRIELRIDDLLFKQYSSQDHQKETNDESLRANTKLVPTMAKISAQARKSLAIKDTIATPEIIKRTVINPYYDIDFNHAIVLDTTRDCLTCDQTFP